MQTNTTTMAALARAFLICLLFVLSSMAISDRGGNRSATNLATDKSLIKLSTSATVYWLQNNRIYPVFASSLSTMQSNNMPGWGTINTVSSLSGFSVGPDFITTAGSSNRILIKLSSAPTIYEVYNGFREPLSSTAFSTRGYSFSDVIDVPSTIRNMFTDATDGMQYIGQTPTDGTAYNPGDTFTVSWQLKNTGSTRWIGYEADWVNATVNGHASENLTTPLQVSHSVNSTDQGNTTTLSVNMIAPSAPGTHYMYWQLKSLDGNLFGIQFFIQVVVNQPADNVQVISTSPAVGTQISSTALFNATWRLKNTGTTTWSNYSAVWIQTSDTYNLTSPLRVSMPVPTTAPGATIDLTVPMIGPLHNGVYSMLWQMANASGSTFGPQFSTTIFVPSTVESFGSDTEGFGIGDSPGSNAGVNDGTLNITTGNLYFAHKDLDVHGRGIDFNFSESYNSQDATGGPLGIGWSHSFNIYLLTNQNGINTIAIHYADGKTLSFGSSDGVTFAPFGVADDKVIKNGDGSWSLIKPDQREFRFSSLGYLQYVQDKNANRISITYNGSNSIASISDTVGRSYTFGYTNFLLTSVTDPIGRTLTFQYMNGRLSASADANHNQTTYSYDANGRLSTLTDARNVQIMSNTYDSDGRLSTQTNGRGNQWRFAYDRSNGRTTVTDPAQKQIVYTYDASNKLLSFTNRVGKQTLITYDPTTGRRTSVTDQNSTANLFRYTYDTNGNVNKSQDPAQQFRSFTYDTKNNPTVATDELLHTTSMVYDAKGNVVNLTDALSRASSISYDSFGEPTAITDPNLNVTMLTYDGAGNLIRREDPLHFVWTFSYDAVGRRTAVTDGGGKTTNFTYDANDNVLTVQLPAGTTMYTYDAVDNVLSVRDPLLNITRYQYDNNNDRTRETDPLGNFVQYTYDNLDRRITMLDKRGDATSYEYDAEGRQTAEVDPVGNRTSFTYDGNGNRLSETAPNGQATTYTYDSLNRLLSTRDPLGNTGTKAYDAAGRLIRETDGRGNSTQFSYDEVNNLTQVLDSANGTTKYTYDKNHNLLTQVDPNNHTTTLTYDADNHLVSSRDDLGNTYQYTYDSVGNRSTQRDAKSQMISFSYDENERLSTITYPNSTTVQISYDGNSNLTQVVDPSGTTQYSYDALSRVTGYRDVFGNLVGYQYDANGNVTVLTYPDGKQVQYAYDAANRMTSLTDWSGRTVSYQYSNLDLLTAITPPISTQNGATTFSYDLAGRLSGMGNARRNSPPNSYTLTLDANGNRVTASVQEPLNNRIATANQNYSYDNANRIQNAGLASYTSDANGNLTSKTESGITTNYSYDFNNRLTNDSFNSYTYNGQGTRVAKTRAGSTTRYVVDPNRTLSQVLCETDGNGNITRYYIYGQGLTYEVEPNGTHYYYYFDPNGSTVALATDLDFDLNRYAYDANGNVTNSVESSPNTVSNPFRYGGRFGITDETNGLLYIRARYYSPPIGRFMTADTHSADKQDSSSLNRYIYASDNPISAVDVNGMYSLRDFGKDAWSFAGGTLSSIVQEGLLDGGTGIYTGYSQLGFRELPYLQGSAIGGLKANNFGGQTAGEAALMALIDAGQDKLLDAIEGPRKNVTLKVGSLPVIDLSKGLPLLDKAPPWVRVVNRAAGGILFRYGVAGEEVNSNGDISYDGKKIGNLRSSGIMGNSTVQKKTTSTKSAIPAKGSKLPITTRYLLRTPLTLIFLPRGPACYVVFPRGPKASPIMPRGPAR